MTWKAPYYNYLNLGLREFHPYPEHILGAAFDQSRDSFPSLPYWTTEWVHLGAFRLIDFGLGEDMVFERFDNYFLGRPKLDRVRVLIIPDPNALFASIQAGSVDLATENTLPIDTVLQLRAQWQQDGGGMVMERLETW